MNFSIKKSLSFFLAMGSFINSSVNAIDSVLEPSNSERTGDYLGLEERTGGCLNLEERTGDYLGLEKRTGGCLSLVETEAEKEERLNAIFGQKISERDRELQFLTIFKLVSEISLFYFGGKLIGSYFPELHKESNEKQALLTDQLTPEEEKNATISASDTKARWSNIKKYYQSESKKQFNGVLNSEKELAYALTHTGEDTFFKSIQSPWAPNGLKGPVFARSIDNLKGDPDRLPDDGEELTNIASKLQNYVSKSCTEFYDSLKKKDDDTLTILNNLENILEALSKKQISDASKELDSILELIDKLLPVLHLFYSISDSSALKDFIRGGLGFALRVPTIRIKDNNEKVLTTSDYLKSFGDRKGTIEINLDTQKIEERLGMNRYGLASTLFNTKMGKYLTSKIYSYFDEKEEGIYSSLFASLKAVIASVHKLLKDQKELISKLFKTVNNEVFNEIDQQENYITLLFKLKTGLKETLLGEKDVETAINEKKQGKVNKELTNEEREEVIKGMKIKRINKDFLTDKIKKQLPDLPVFREIGEFFVDKFFDELGFTYE